MTEKQASANLRWRLEELDFSALDAAKVQARDDIFLLVCSASFVESGADLYAQNLVDYFVGDAEAGAWLDAHWMAEELQHGLALKAYVQQVWPDFDWDGAYADFLAEYSKLCTTDELEPTRGQEMVARCIVEMGTTTYYQALHAVSDEPVLRDLCWRIRTDEVQHYKHFYHNFLELPRARAPEPPASRCHAVAPCGRAAPERRRHRPAPRLELALSRPPRRAVLRRNEPPAVHAHARPVSRRHGHAHGDQAAAVARLAGAAHGAPLERRGALGFAALSYRSDSFPCLQYLDCRPFLFEICRRQQKIHVLLRAAR